MSVSIDLRARHLLWAAGLLATVFALTVWWGSPAQSQPPAAQAAAEQPLSTFAFLARADNPVDALAGSSVAGQLGAPVFLTGTATLDEQASRGLADHDPQVVVLAGGTAALSTTVEEQVRQLLPEAQVRRIGGQGRTETARLVNELTSELGINRPVLSGASVPGPVGIDGTLTLAGTDVGQALAALSARLDALESDLAAADTRIGQLQTTVGDLTGRVDSLEQDDTALTGRVDTLEQDDTALTGRVDALEATFAGVERRGPVLLLDGMNLQVVNGGGTTASQNGLGNLIVGYNEDLIAASCYPSPEDCQVVGDNKADNRVGSHNLVLGLDSSYTGYGGIVAGVNHLISAPFASVTGGKGNTASNRHATVTGGNNNTASGLLSTVSGGQVGTASGFYASITGGRFNTASGNSSTVSGGDSNDATAFVSTVAGGDRNTASGSASTASGGYENSATASASTVLGGRSGVVSDAYDSRVGNTAFVDG